ncbi:hypothetical protein HPB47_024391 [Ixodes persulcatus]|uniref:Uncharacterized protein n=1 Tax=Ixodes persulcatus TaxID=34615 RepID=A0AC60Q6Q9_IXOPE|nr:hypothetical protein HPB47_024391 [Ixodes persulcatus]
MPSAACAGGVPSAATARGKWCTGRASRWRVGTSGETPRLMWGTSQCSVIFILGRVAADVVGEAADARRPCRGTVFVEVPFFVGWSGEGRTWNEYGSESQVLLSRIQNALKGP